MKRFQPLLGILGLLFVVTRLYAQDPLTNGLVAFYRFDGNLDDSSGNGNNGALTGSDWKYGFDRFAQSDSALYLNVTSTPAANLDGAYVVAPRSAALNFNQDFTLSVWINISGAVSNYYVHNLISNGLDTNSTNFRVISDVNTNGQDYLWFVYAHANGASPGAVAAFVPRFRDSWWHAVVVRSGVTLSLFRNGVLLAKAALATTLSNTPSIWFGRYNCGSTIDCPGSYALMGGLDEVRMYNRSLSAQEVQQLYQYEANALPYLAVAVKTVRLSLFVEVGTTNQLYTSTTLGGWTTYGPPFVATNSIMYQDVDILGGTQQYFRVAQIP